MYLVSSSSFFFFIFNSLLISHTIDALSFNDKLDRKIAVSIYSNCVEFLEKVYFIFEKVHNAVNITSDRF